MAASSNKTNQRRAPRLQLTPKGEISDGATTVKALLQDISDDGMLLICSKDFAVGKVIELKFHMPSGASIECTCEVRHSSDMGTGVKIVAMTDQHRRAYEQYLQEYFSQHLGKLG